MSVLTDIKAALEAFKAAETAWDALPTPHQCNDTDRAFDEAYIDLGDILVANAPALVAAVEAAERVEERYRDVLIGISGEDLRAALAKLTSSASYIECDFTEPPETDGIITRFEAEQDCPTERT